MGTILEAAVQVVEGKDNDDEDDDLPVSVLAPRRTKVPQQIQWLDASAAVRVLDSPSGSEDEELLAWQQSHSAASTGTGSVSTSAQPPKLQWQLWEEDDGFDEEAPLAALPTGMGAEQHQQTANVESTELLWSTSAFTQQLQRWLQSVQLPEQFRAEATRK